jgi:hypothetical protein
MKPVPWLGTCRSRRLPWWQIRFWVFTRTPETWREVLLL